MTPHRNPSLTYFDFIVLSFVFFGYFSYIAVAGYFASPAAGPVSASSFSDTTNWFSVISELGLLTVAAGYLRLRKFDCAKLNFSINSKTLPLVIGLVAIGSLTTDMVLYGGYWLSTGQNPLPFEASPENPSSGSFSHISIGLLLFALVNGFYEELFFMGLAFAVKSEHRVYALISSIFIRFVFHIYQGLLPAVAIAVTGVIFILLRRKIRSITPFVLAHAVFDIFGAGVISWVPECIIHILPNSMNGVENF